MPATRAARFRASSAAVAVNTFAGQPLALVFAKQQYRSGGTYVSGPVAAAGANQGGISNLPGYAFSRSGVTKLEVEAYVNGPELVTNGTFDTDLTGWTNLSAGTGSVAVSSGAAVFTSTDAANYGSLKQDHTVVSGKTYRVSFKITGANLYSYATGQTHTPGSYSVDVVASGTTLNNRFDGSSGTATLDDVSVVQVDANLANGTYLGDELVTNGGFDADANWNKGAGSTISGGKLNANASGFAAVVDQTLAGATVGRLYRVTFDAEISSGAVAARIGNSGTAVTASATGSYSVDATATGTTNLIFFEPNGASFVGSIDNISVREVIPEAFDTFAPHVPAIIPGKGYWSRAAVTNLLLQSQAFDTASWTKENLTVTANAALAPDGTLTADRIVEAATTSNHDFYQDKTITAETLNTVSVYMKAGERRYAGLSLFGNGSNYHTIVVDLQTGTVTATATAGATSTSHKVTSVGNGWYRLQVSGVLPTFTIIYALPFLSDVATPTFTSGRLSYLGDTTMGAFMWQAQLVAGTDPGPIIPTTTAAATVGEDNLSQNIFPDGSALTDQDMLIWARGTLKQTSNNSRVLILSDGTSSNRVDLLFDTTNKPWVHIDAAGVTQISHVSAAAIGVDKEFVLFARRAGGAWRAGYIVDGVLTWIAAATTSSFPTGLSKVNVGNFHNGGSPLNGTIADARIRKGTFSTDAEVIAAVTA